MKYKVSILILILIAFIAYIGWYIWKAYPAAYKYNANILVRCLESYIEQNEGRFPQSESELTEKGFLDKNGNVIRLKCLEKNVVDGKQIETEVWNRCARFQAFQIYYGTSFDDIILNNNTLFDKDTNREILLIEGPLPSWLPYKQYSYTLYKAGKKKKVN